MVNHPLINKVISPPRLAFIMYSSLSFLSLSLYRLPLPPTSQGSAAIGMLSSFSTLPLFVTQVAFTGSVATGTRISQACAGALRHCSLELGGKSALILCAVCCRPPPPPLPPPPLSCLLLLLLLILLLILFPFPCPTPTPTTPNPTLRLVLFFAVWYSVASPLFICACLNGFFSSLSLSPLPLELGTVCMSFF